jgi:hypothetical protein
VTLGAVFTPHQPGSLLYRASVFWHQIESFAVAARIPSATLLGDVIAHEIGHLLLGSGAHAASGIMKANWRGPESVLVAQGRMLFDKSDAIRLRRSIFERKGTHAKPPALPGINADDDSQLTNTLLDTRPKGTVYESVPD